MDRTDDIAPAHAAALAALYGEGPAPADPDGAELVARWTEVRDVVRSAREQGFDAEPPARIDALLLAAARHHVPTRAGVWSRLRGWLIPLVAHPALAGTAALVVVGGAAGVMYMRGKHTVSAPQVHVGGGSASAGQSDQPPPPAPPPLGDDGKVFDTETYRSGAPGAEPAAVGATTAGAGGGSTEDGDLTTDRDKHDEATGVAGGLSIDDRGGRDLWTASGNRGGRGGRGERGARGGSEQSGAGAGRHAEGETASLDRSRAGGGAGPTRTTVTAVPESGTVVATGTLNVDLASRQQIATDDRVALDGDGGGGTGSRGDSGGAGAGDSGAGTARGVTTRLPARSPAKTEKPAAPPPAAPPPGPTGGDRAGDDDEAPDDVSERDGANRPREVATEDRRISDAGGAGTAQRDEARRTPSAREQAEQLTRQARTASRRKDCAAVKVMARRVKSLDKAYYAAVFAKDADIAGCL